MKVLLIRREADGLRTAALLEQNGLIPVILPLFEKIDIAAPKEMTSPDFLVFTSAAAVESVSANELADFDHVPAYAVGPRTADALKNKEYSNVRMGSGNANDLALLIRSDHEAQKARGIYYCAEDRAFDMQGALAKSGISLEQREVYRMEKCFVEKDRFLQALNSVQNGAILIFSQRSADHLLHLVRQYEAYSLLETIEFIAISEKTCLTLGNELVKSVHISDVPNETSMIDKVKSLSRD